MTHIALFAISLHKISTAEATLMSKLLATAQIPCRWSRTTHYNNLYKFLRTHTNVHNLSSQESGQMHSSQFVLLGSGSRKNQDAFSAWLEAHFFKILKISPLLSNKEMNKYSMEWMLCSTFLKKAHNLSEAYGKCSDNPIIYTEKVVRESWLHLGGENVLQLLLLDNFHMPLKARATLHHT